MAPSTRAPAGPSSLPHLLPHRKPRAGTLTCDLCPPTSLPPPFPWVSMTPWLGRVMGPPVPQPCPPGHVAGLSWKAGASPPLFSARRSPCPVHTQASHTQLFSSDLPLRPTFPRAYLAPPLGYIRVLQSPYSPTQMQTPHHALCALPRGRPRCPDHATGPLLHSGRSSDPTCSLTDVCVCDWLITQPYPALSTMPGAWLMQIFLRRKESTWE